MPDAISAEDAIGAFYIDERLFATIPGLRGRLVRALPYRLAQLLEVLLRGRDYDAVFTWSDAPAIAVAALMRMWPRRPAHVALLYWPSKPKKAIAWGFVQRGVDRFILWPPLQRRFLQERLGVAPGRFVDVRPPVDTRFWRPIEAPQERICAVGQEMRDYGTLVAALAPLSIPCHIAVGASVFATTSERWWQDSLTGGLPAHITVGPKPYSELRDLYASSRFMVVPLLPSDMDNGITAILEAFAMGRAVIVTESPGQVGVLEEGVNCLRVPPHDPLALREAIVRLWEDRSLCARLGAAGRALVLERHGLDQWRAALVRAVSEAVAVRAQAAPRHGAPPRLD
jgi:glycosyltransferase involved in cell wall biosynthesis